MTRESLWKLVISVTLRVIQGIRLLTMTWTQYSQSALGKLLSLLLQAWARLWAKTALPYRHVVVASLG